VVINEDGNRPAPGATVRPGAAVMFARALLRRCPRCGRKGIFSGWFSLPAACPRCGLALEREEGYWLGAMAVNLGITELLFAVLLVTWAVLAWPDVPWVWLTVAGLALNAIVPIVFYPISKTIFLAVDLLTLHTDERTWTMPPDQRLPADREPERPR
jgi:uncharacterized protein (DUF983 family)